MQPAILIVPKELANRIKIGEAIYFMHLVGVIDGFDVRILKNRFESGVEKIPLFDIGYYIQNMINLGGGVYSPTESLK